jgi:hypothetical protein
MEQLTKGKITDIRNILWVGLIHEEVEFDQTTGEPVKYLISPYQVGSWIKGPSMLQEVSQKIVEALGMSMSGQGEVQDDELTAKLAEQGFKMGKNGLERLDTKND